MMNSLKLTEFGNPILRQEAKRLSVTEIKSLEIAQLIAQMRHTLEEKRLGIGLAAPQVGHGISLAVIMIQPTKHRPNVKQFDRVMINPKITRTFGYRKQMWEGCLSAGSSGLFAKAPRYKKLEIEFYDAQAKKQIEIFEGLQAQVVQHEVDHLNGTLFIDRVQDTKTYMTLREYKQRIAKIK